MLHYVHRQVADGLCLPFGAECIAFNRFLAENSCLLQQKLQYEKCEINQNKQLAEACYETL